MSHQSSSRPRVFTRRIVLACALLLVLVTGTLPSATAAGAAQRHGHAATSIQHVHTAASTNPYAPFVREWEGHDRTLQISSHGLGHEVYYSGCCPPLTRYTFQLSRAHKLPGGRPVARLTITGIHTDKGGYRDKRIHIGSYGTATSIRGVFYDPVTGGTFCDPSAAAHSECGA